jgi:hypothetical protein
VDTVAPATSIFAGPSGQTGVRAARFSFSSNEAGATFECSLDGAPYSACATPWTYSRLDAGAHEFAVRAIDQAGNVDASPATASWTVIKDTTPPTVELVQPTTGVYVNGSRLYQGGPIAVITGPATITVQAQDLHSGLTSMTVDVDGTPIHATAYDEGDRSPESAQLSYTFAPGPHTLRVRATNDWDITSTASVQVLAS